MVDETIITSIVADLSSNDDDLALESTQVLNWELHALLVILSSTNVIIQLLDAYNSPKIEYDETKNIYSM